MELFWPDSEPTAAATNLRSLVHGIRQALQELGGEGLLISDRDSISLDASANIWVDADVFDEVVAKARLADDPVPLLETASELYKGDFLADDVFEDWASERREALRLIWEDVQFQLAQRYEQRGEQESALARLLAVLLVDRCNERAGQEAMRLLIDLGRRPEALRVFNALQVALQDDLGVTPSQRTLELQRLATRSDAPTTHPRTQRFRCAYSFPQPRELIGRTSELERLQRLIERGRSSGQALLLSAPAGTGKSTLLGALVRSAQDRGVLCLVGGSYDQRSAVPLVAFEEALTDYILTTARESSESGLPSSAGELVDIHQELRQHLGLSGAPQIDLANARMRLFGAILSFVRSLAERGPLLLCVEDLHAADAASLQLLHFLVRQTRHSPVVVIGTFRHEELRPGEPLAQLVSGLEREGIAEHVRLAPLDQQATGRLATLLSDGPISETARKALHQLTEGNPLFIEQVMLTLGAHGQIDELVNVGQQIIGHGADVPLIIRELIVRRLVDMSNEARATMEIAAVLGSAFDETTLLTVSAPTEEPALLTHLDEAIRLHILRETPNGYAFQHALLREGVYWNLSRPRRTLLHRRAGEVLEAQAKGRIPQHAAELAYHFSLAGHSADARSKAFQYSLIAGRQTQALTAYREAVGHFTRASELLDSDLPDASVTEHIEVLIGRGEAEQEIGHWIESLRTWEQVLGLSQDPLQRARARSNMAYGHVELGRIDEVTEDVRGGMEDLRGIVGPEAARFRLELLQWSAFVLYLRGRYHQVLELGEQMLAEAQLLGTARPLFISYCVLAWGYSGLGRSKNALEQHELAIATTIRSGHRVNQAMAHQNAGMQQYLSGNFNAAEEQLQRARTLFYDSANEARALHAMQHQCTVWLARGELSRAHAQASLALELSQSSEVRWAADSYQILGHIASLRAQWQEAERCFKHALKVRINVGVMDDSVETLLALGTVYEITGDWTNALDHYTRALDRASDADPSPKLVGAQTQLGVLRLHRGEWKGAAQLIGAAVALAETIPDTLESRRAQLGLAELRLIEGHPGAAREIAERALSTEMAIEDVVNAHLLLARACAALGDVVGGAHAAGSAQELAASLGSPYLISRAWLAVGWIAASRGDALAAVASFESAAQQADAAHATYELTLAIEALIKEGAQRHGVQDTATLRARLTSLREQLGASAEDALEASIGVPAPS